MIVRNPTPSEVDACAETAAKAFPNLSLEHWYGSFRMVAEVFGERFILMVEDEGKIASTLICQPAPVYINGGLITHSSTGAVATLPESRCRGCAGAMMAECVRVLNEEGIYLSSLWPFSYEYYRKFGWEIGSEIRLYSGEAKVFAPLGDPGKARGAVEGDLALVIPIFDAYAQSYNCLTQRSQTWWNRVIKINEPLKLATQPEDGRGVIIHETDGEADGYIIYEVGVNEEKKFFSIKEIVFFESEHRRDMLSFLAALDPEASINFNAPYDDLFLQELPNPRVINSTINASFQFRVTDPERAMEALVVDDEVTGKLTFALTDPVFTNGFEFGIEVEGGKISVCAPDPKNRLETDIRIFARLYSGYLNAFDACELGKLKVTGNATEVLMTACEVFSPLTPYRSWLEPG